MAGRAPGTALAAVLAGVVMSALMQTLLANASPRIATELSVGTLYPWIAGGYMLAATSAIPVFAQYADRLGARRVFVFGYASYGTGTVLLALAPNAVALIGARVVQGLGAGAILPAALASVGLLFTAEARARAMAAVGVVQVAANIIGPALSGWFTDGPGWRWGALVPLPILLVTLLLAPGLPTAAVTEDWWRIDVREPLSLLRRGAVAPLVFLATLVGTLTLGLLNYVPLLLQEGRGASASASGWVLIPMLIATGLGTAVSGRLAGYRWFQPSGWLLMTAGTPLALAPSLTVVGLSLAGAGAGMVLPTLLLATQRAVAADQLAQASGLIQLGRNVGGAVGIPILGLWLAAGLPTATALAAILITLSLTTALGLALSLRLSRVRSCRAHPTEPRPRQRRAPRRR